MKICWDNLEKIRYNNKTKTFRYNRTTYYEKMCDICGDFYLGQKKNNFCSDECRSINHSKIHKNFKHSESSKEKISNKLKNRIFSDDHKKKISLSLTGKGFSDRHRKNISLKAKMRYNIKTNHPNWKGGYYQRNVPLYNTYKDLYPYEEIKRNNIDINILEVKCTYCGCWFIPTNKKVQARKNFINGHVESEHRLYCSNQCKYNCPIYKQIKYPKGFKPATSREVQPELRQMVFERDNWTCQKCKKHKKILKVGLHCHHIEGIMWEPLESADMDMCITYCADCHKEVHKIDGCGYHEMKCI